MYPEKGFFENPIFPPLPSFQTSHTYVERRVVSPSSRVQNAACGVVFGLILLISSPILLFWNEGRAVEVAKMLDEARNSVVEIEAEQSGNYFYLDYLISFQQQLERDEKTGKMKRKFPLIHMTGNFAFEELIDSQMGGVGVRSIVLEREVEMYQWEEHRSTHTTKDSDGQEVEETTITYSPKWSSSLISSGSFRFGYDNPSSFPFESEKFVVKEMLLGGLKLSNDLASLAIPTDVLTLTASQTKSCRSPRGDACYPMGNFVYFKPSSDPEIGDLRVQFRYWASAESSIMGELKGQTVNTWKSSNGRTLALLVPGNESADEMIDREVRNNTLMTWGLRVLGFFLMFLGLNMTVEPIFKVIEYVPLIGGIAAGILRFASTIVIFLISLSASLIIIAIGWLWARPLVSVTLAACALASFFLAGQQAKKASNNNNNNPEKYT